MICEWASLFTCLQCQAQLTRPFHDPAQRWQLHLVSMEHHIIDFEWTVRMVSFKTRSLKTGKTWSVSKAWLSPSHPGVPRSHWHNRLFYLWCALPHFTSFPLISLVYICSHSEQSVDFPVYRLDFQTSENPEKQTSGHLDFVDVRIIRTPEGKLSVACRLKVCHKDEHVAKKKKSFTQVGAPLNFNQKEANGQTAGHLCLLSPEYVCCCHGM